MGEDVCGEKVQSFQFIAVYYTEWLLYMPVEQDDPEELAYIWSVNKTILAYSYWVN